QKISDTDSVVSGTVITGDIRRWSDWASGTLAKTAFTGEYAFTVVRSNFKVAPGFCQPSRPLSKFSKNICCFAVPSPQSPGPGLVRNVNAWVLSTFPQTFSAYSRQ